jgi:DNA-binding CsgD family transcriptional regulator
VTEAEKRLLALTKLEMSNSEIAAMLGISPESVIKTRYRLRKKVGDEDLKRLVESF